MASAGRRVSVRGDARRVIWLSFARLDRTPRGYSSALASARYRLILPAEALGRMGFDSTLAQFPAQAEPHALLERFGAAEAVVLGKVLARPGEGQAVLDLIGALRVAGVKVLADFSDDHFANPLLGPFQRALASSVDAVVASTPPLAEVLRSVTAAPIVVVSDPVEGERGEPRAPASGGPLRLLWYGHPTNLDTLDVGLPQLEPLAAQHPVSLLLVTAPGAGAEQAAAAHAQRWRGRGGDCRFLGWSVQVVFDELRNCDAVVIPSDPADPRKAVKSPNRFTEALWAGRFVLAHPLPAYRALADYGWIGNDLGAGARWLLDNREAALARIRAGQAQVSAHFTPDVIGQTWKAAITATLSG